MAKSDFVWQTDLIKLLWKISSTLKLWHSLTFTSFPGFLSLCLISEKKEKEDGKFIFWQMNVVMLQRPKHKVNKNLYETKICHHFQNYDIWCHHRWPGNSIVYRNHRIYGGSPPLLCWLWWQSTIWKLSEMVDYHHIQVLIWWKVIIWCRSTIIFYVIARAMACRPVRVQTGEYKVLNQNC